MMNQRCRVIIIGGGLAGLSAAMQLADRGILVELFSLTKVKRSHSVCAQGGINAALNLKGENDSPYIHAYDTIKGGDFLADQPPVLEMCLTAPRIIHMLDRFGCPFNRDADGNLDVRRFGGTLYHRTVFCGASTGQQLMYTMDEQVRRRECQGKIIKRENHEFVRLITNTEGRACGVVVMNLFNHRLEVIQGDAVIIATGGLGVIFKMSTNSTICTGAANGRLFMQGMHYANPEFIQIHPTAISGLDKLRLISESVRGEGGRVWVPGCSSKTIIFPDGSRRPCGETGKPWYFLEEMYPAYGNLVSRDVGARAILQVCEAGLGIDGRHEVFLDVTHLPVETLNKLVAGDEAARFVESFGSCIYSQQDLNQALQQELEISREILSRQGGENAFALHEEIARVMVSNVTVKRENKALEETLHKLKEFRERIKKVSVHDSSRFANKTFHFVRQMEPMLELALAITTGALLRNEFRGSHYKPEFSKRDDVNG